MAQGRRGRDLKADEGIRCTETRMISKGKSLLRSVCPSGKLLKSLALGGPGSVLRSRVPPAAPSHPCQAELPGSVRPSCSTPLLPFPLVSPLPCPCTPGATAALCLGPRGTLCSCLHSFGLPAMSDPGEAPSGKPEPFRRPSRYGGSLGCCLPSSPPLHSNLL